MKIIDKLNKSNENTKLKEENNKELIKLRILKDKKYFIIHYIGILLNIILIINLLILIIKSKSNLVRINEILKNFKINKFKKISLNRIELNPNYYYRVLKKEADLPNLKEFYSKRTFEKRIPLPKEITCKPHIKNEELIGFLSFLTKDTIFFETGSGCSSIIAKYYSKKTYAVEGCQKYYEYGIKNGLKDVIIFKDLKPDVSSWSKPGKKSNLPYFKK